MKSVFNEIRVLSSPHSLKFASAYIWICWNAQDTNAGLRLNANADLRKESTNATSRRCVRLCNTEYAQGLFQLQR